MITSTGLDLSDLRTGPDFVSAMLDQEAWQAIMTEVAAENKAQSTTNQDPLNTIAHGAKSTVGNHETR